MSGAKIDPKKLDGPWVEGYVLDFHSIRSAPTGDPYHPFDTTRTTLGELVYRFKYRGERIRSGDIVDTLYEFIRSWSPPIDCVVPAPASLDRMWQPVLEIARQLAARLAIPVCEDAVIKSKRTAQMKDISDWSERQRLLSDAIQLGQAEVNGKRVLLIDDVLESGSTLRRAADVLLKEGGATAVYAVVLTRTR